MKRQRVMLLCLKTLNSVRFLLRPMKTGSLCSAQKMSAMRWGIRTCGLPFSDMLMTHTSRNAMYG